MVGESRGLARSRVQGSCCQVRVFRTMSRVLASKAFKERSHESRLFPFRTTNLEFISACVAQDGFQPIVDRLIDPIVATNRVRVVVSG